MSTSVLEGKFKESPCLQEIYYSESNLSERKVLKRSAGSASCLFSSFFYARLNAMFVDASAAASLFIGPGSSSVSLGILSPSIAWVSLAASLQSLLLFSQPMQKLPLEVTRPRCWLCS
jgi:hypothetical protein